MYMNKRGVEENPKKYMETFRISNAMNTVLINIPTISYLSYGKLIIDILY